MILGFAVQAVVVGWAFFVWSTELTFENNEESLVLWFIVLMWPASMLLYIVGFKWKYEGKLDK